VSHAAEHMRNNTQHVKIGTVFSDRSGWEWRVNWCNGLIVEAFNNVQGNRDFPVGMVAGLLRRAAAEPPVCGATIEVPDPDKALPEATQPAVVECTMPATRRITILDTVFQSATGLDGRDISVVCDQHAADLRASAARQRIHLDGDEAL